jgi:hypothetical protein
MNLDISTTVRTIFVMLLIAAGVLIFMAVRIFREANRLRFFLKKRALLGRAWQLIFIALLVIGGAFAINSYAEPVTYRIFEPSPTPTQTPTITLTPTITQTATSTQTATITSQVTPNPNAVFSALSFSRTITEDYVAIDPAVSFENPVQTINATFSYDNMTVGTQWTAMWYHEGKLIHYETKPWNGASGGYGYSDCTLPAEDWLPGTYEVQMFIGEQWKTSGTFTITGTPPTPTITPTLTATVTSTPQPSSTATLTPVNTTAPTATQTTTLLPSQTAVPSATAAPTNTLTPTQSPTPTLVPTATRRSTIYR